MEDLLKALAALLLMTAQACASVVNPLPQTIRHIEIDSAYASYFADARDTQTSEYVLCLYGAVRNDTAWLNFIRPARMRERTTHRAVYDGCPRVKFPTLVADYLGTWHGHNVDGWDACQFSDIDSRSFAEDNNAILELMSCKGKLMARSKRK